MKQVFTIFILVLIASSVSASDHKGVTLEHSYKFPDFGFMLSPDSYHGPVFRLSADYPEKLPELDEDVSNILNIDFRTDWYDYAMAVRNYAFKNNINSEDNALSFDFSGEQAHRWFHVPWQHWGSTGREGFHGLTREGPLSANVLAPEQDDSSYAYAVGFYNRQGGYAIGRVWEDYGNPDPSYVAENGFPVGTVVAKFLFTTLDSSQVPYLVNPMEWTAYVYTCDIPGNPTSPCDKREATTVHLLQMDIMIKDPRATDSNSWVFGTFVYNGNLNNDNRWENLQPVGIMWGNNPEVTLSNANPAPTETRINKKLTQTIINPDPSLPPMHLGWNSRLNGPADNPYSACMSCHSTAQFPAVSAIMPFLNNPKVDIPPDGTDAPAAWMRWFRNFDSNVAFDGDKAMTTDFSLQLSKSLQNFIEYRSETEQGCFNVEYWTRGHKVARGSHLNTESSSSDDAGCR